jgi:NADPH:quinone reductase
MRAITIDRPDTPPALREDLPAPTAADNEVLVRVQASSANPVDNAIAAGMLAGMGVEHDYPVVLGRDYAGVIEQTGAAVSRYRPGDQVYGYLLHANPTVHDGAWAELITVTEDLSIAPAPAGIDLAIAGAAARAGARILAPALPEDETFLREQGVSDVLPRDGDIARLVRDRVPDGVDALLDLVNYAPGTYDAALKPGARIASPTGAAGEGPGRTNVMAAPSPENLQRLGALLADGTLRMSVQATYELAQAPAALSALTGEHTQGKLAIRVR